MNVRFKTQFQNYMAPADDGTGGGGGGGGGDDGAAEAAAAAEAQAAAEAAATAATEAAATAAAAAAAALAAKSKTKPTDEEARLLKENMKRKDDNKKLADELAALKGLTGTVEELGGLDALKALVAANKDTATKALEAKGDWDRLKANMAEQHTKENAALAKKLEDSQALVDASTKTITEITVGSEFAQSTYIREELLLTPMKARALYGSHFEFEDGKTVGYDKPRGEANRTQLVDGSGNPLSFNKAMDLIIEADPEKDQLKKAKGKPGAGSDTRRGTTTAKVDLSEMSGRERIAAALAARNKAR